MYLPENGKLLQVKRAELEVENPSRDNGPVESNYLKTTLRCSLGTQGLLGLVKSLGLKMLSAQT